MAKIIRSPELATQNWTSRTQAAANLYRAQVEASSWKAFAASDQAEKNYAAAVTTAVNEKRRQKAVAAVDDTVWKAGVAAVGVARFSQGVAASAPKMGSVMSKLIPAIDQTRKALPPRGVRGSQDNINRMVNFVQGMAKLRGTIKARGVAKSS